MPRTLRYVTSTSSRIPPSPGTSSPCSPTRVRSTRRRCRRSRRRSASPRRPSSSLRRIGRHGADAHLQPSRRRCSSPATRFSAPPGCSRRPLQRAVIELETGKGVVPVELDRDESGALVFGRMVQPTPTISAVDDTECALRCAGRAWIGAPGRALRQRSDAHRRHARRRCCGRCACRPTRLRSRGSA